MTRPPPPPGSYRREGPGLEFDRVSFFSDAVYAIAMTLLVVELSPPEIETADPRALLAAILASWPHIFGFFLGFLLLGRYWLAHHDFFASLRSIDRTLISINLLYLAFVAFMPYAVAMISEHEDNPVGFVVFAVCMAIISGLEVALYAVAVRGGHTRVGFSPEAVRFGYVAAGMPVVVMLASLPLAFVDPTLALLSWLVTIPLGAWIHRRIPPEFARGGGDETN
ncbi:TMEM175 family protein [Amaricoccus sp.]|uniref:TMEM175 family protein n=1 Tax=Amaricoccus sp. TaxID=1872485 RepID=UPI001B758695|nr:TMEM175 family protein [Amaricoccus sp.]MBP7002016.1 DUF1211 domain-containing protein [Amaricoccus sp.]